MADMLQHSNTDQDQGPKISYCLSTMGVKIFEG